MKKLLDRVRDAVTSAPVAKPAVPSVRITAQTGAVAAHTLNVGGNLYASHSPPPPKRRGVKLVQLIASCWLLWVCCAGQFLYANSGYVDLLAVREPLFPRFTAIAKLTPWALQSTVWYGPALGVAAFYVVGWLAAKLR